jgi:hypothetical protein
MDISTVSKSQEVLKTLHLSKKATSFHDQTSHPSSGTRGIDVFVP